MAAPKLRFKEFDKAFSRNTIKELAKIYVGRDLVEDAYSPIKTETHIYPIYSNSVDNEGLYGYYNFEEFNFDDDALTVVGRGAGLGKAFYRQGGFGTIGRLLSLTPKDKSFHPKYLSDYINDKLIIHNESGGIPQLPRSSLENYEVVLPSYEEQTKIASFLSNVDEKISKLTEKHALLSQYKQGMMQKLFSQQIRFKADDGSEFGEWDYLELNEVLDYEQPTKYIVKSTDYDSSYLTPVLTAGKTFILGYTNETSGIFEGDKENVIIFDDFTTAYKFVNFRFKVKSSAMKILKLNHFQNNIFYIYSVFSLLNLPLGDEHKRRWISEYSKQEIPVPCLEEQTKISNFLSAIDQKIEVVAQQIEQAKTWKKGLLQQMFIHWSVKPRGLARGYKRLA